MSVIGSISIRDNATAVLKNIRNEQITFRKDVIKTKGELKATWDKQYKARLEATAAAKKARELRSRLDPLRKKLVVAMAVKDLATDKVKAVTRKIKDVGRMVVRPVVNVVVKGAQLLSGIGKGIASAAKTAAIGIGAVGAAGAAALKAVFSGSEDLARAQIAAETKLEAVLGNVASIQERGAGAAQAAKQKLMGIASQLQGIGVIGDEVTLAGMQQLATFQLSEKEISILAGGMTDLLAQQKGLNASQEDAVGIANMIGKAMNGQASALSRVGITFNEAQKKALETGTAEERAAVLSEILQQNVGGVNQALAETDQGRIQQMANAYGDMKEEVGKLALSMKAKLSAVVMKNIPTIQKLGTTMIATISKFADKAMPVIDSLISNLTPTIEGVLSGIGDIADQLIPVVGEIFKGLKSSAATAGPVIAGILNGFKAMQPQLSTFAGTVFSTVQQIATAALPVISNIISTIQAVLPTVIPVLETVVSTVGGVISAAAPIISGMVTGIVTVVSTLAPIFQTIFTEIGQKVGSVISFVGERMGFIQGVIETVAPVIGDIISTAWSVISPVIDIAVSVFKILFGIVQKVFPGIQKVIETVWNVIKPLVEGIGKVVGKIARWFGSVADAINGSSPEDPAAVGANARGDNNWKGGLTWVGEEGAELVDLPRGSRILPHKESVALTAGRPAKEAGTAKVLVTNVARNILPGGKMEVPSGEGWSGSIENAVNDSCRSGFAGNAVGANARGDNNWKGGLTWVGEKGAELVDLPRGSRILPHKESVTLAAGRPAKEAGTAKGAVTNVTWNILPGGRSDRSSDSGTVTEITDILKEILSKIKGRNERNPDRGESKKAGLYSGSQVIIQKLADRIEVRDESDIDEVADRVAKKFLEVAANMG